MITHISREEAMRRLKEGNTEFIGCTCNPGNVSPQIREETYTKGQHPYATVIACSDSREIPEAIFSCGIGEIFTIRVAGNVIAETQLASIEYAAEHLGVPITVVLGHTNCGAVASACEGCEEGHIGVLTHDIQKAIGDEHDLILASRRNVLYQVAKIRNAFGKDFPVVGALYHIESGVIDWLI